MTLTATTRVVCTQCGWTSNAGTQSDDLDRDLRAQASITRQLDDHRARFHSSTLHGAAYALRLHEERSCGGEASCRYCLSSADEERALERELLSGWDFVFGFLCLAVSVFTLAYLAIHVVAAIARAR